ncbi:hypothetical protein DL93DRAFT_2227700 [Clavulina sp. PMI_390]|nr:hypothetical protein DL93DRAFT_2227700 [Clavulina sp. PMI_390]
MVAPPLDPALRSSLSTIKAGTEEALQTLFVLQQTINNGGVPEMAPWPEILDKYDVMSRKLQGLQHTLERGFASPDAAGFLRFNSLRDVAIVPAEPFAPGEPQNGFNALTGTMREPSVREADEIAVARINDRLQLENMADEAVNPRMNSLIDEHDSRVSAAVSIIEDIASQYNWTKREEDLEEDDEAQDDAGTALGGPSQESIGASVSQRVVVDHDDDGSDDDMEMVAG